MALIHDIERLGRAADAGEITRDAAAQALVDAGGGGLTLVGAGGILDNWQNQRAAYQAEFTRAAATMPEIYGLDDIQP
jgi:hypothetical protein